MHWTGKKLKIKENRGRLVIQSIEAVIGSDGQIVLSKAVSLKYPHRAIVTILDDPATEEVTLLSEQALAADWLREEEDQAWAHLQ